MCGRRQRRRFIVCDEERELQEKCGDGKKEDGDINAVSLPDTHQTGWQTNLPKAYCTSPNAPEKSMTSLSLLRTA
jgi:hypothetical protein